MKNPLDFEGYVVAFVSPGTLSSLVMLFLANQRSGLIGSLGRHTSFGGSGFLSIWSINYNKHPALRVKLQPTLRYEDRPLVEVGMVNDQEEKEKEEEELSMLFYLRALCHDPQPLT
ncbi:hypothetical protein K440DRAFT_128261 [Wilcoxina mikolae CBS 423.85]|nr:hypothetical protein K440DRAFT_128261 [Wilcoxina mikolae CBS 423.85]